MSTADDDSSSGINGRLRPRKSYASSPQSTKATRKSDLKSTHEKPKRVTPIKALITKPDDLSKKSDCSSVIEYLCPYCDKTFVSKQTASKHARRIHFSSTKLDTFINCLYCNHTESEPNEIFKHMIDSHPNQYFACLDCHTRFVSTKELAEHKLNVCERQKLPYRSKLRKKSSRPSKKTPKIERQVVIQDQESHGYNGIVISCELKPTHDTDAADIEDNIPTNLILPSNKNLGNKVIDNNAVILLDDLQWNKRIPHNFSFHNADADQILSRLGVVHRSPRTGESTRKDWFKTIDDVSQKFERCFDTSFYSKVASNVQENLSKFLDGSFNFNPDPNHTIKTRKAKNSVPINTVEGFPILLSSEQYSRNLFDGYLPRAIAPKHKWKWDNLESDRNPLSPDQIKRDSHVNNCIVTLVSSLDIWTQLCMRKKFEEKFKTSPTEKKIEKKKIIGNELKEILESRQLPTPTTHPARSSTIISPVRDNLDFPSSLGLTPTTAKYDVQPAVLSGEWVRPRCYVCCACGAQTRDPRALSSHISTQHPTAQVQHYEIPGELLINADILKHLYVPPSPVHNRTRPPRGFRECTKCNKSITLDDLHQHMLDCAGDMPTVRRKCRYRQFGVRKRRTRIQDNRIRKKIRKDIHRQNGRPRPKIRTEVGDAETIRKMLADLPAKRHRVMINPLSLSLRPKRKLVKQRNQLALTKRPTDESKSKKINATAKSDDNPENSNPNKANNAQDENKCSLKGAQNKLPRRKVILNKKTVSKTRRRNVQRRQDVDHTDKDAQINVCEAANSSSEIVRKDELSTDNKSYRINVNSGPYNVREQANRSNNDGSNNRENQNQDRNDNNGNSNDQGSPPQNVPLKHSIARLTADSDTQDKAVQFHHLFLVQQECNNLTQHVPSGQPVLFENKDIAAKLDKPPLEQNQKDEIIIDAHNHQKSKLTKHRKGLNDCIAMLKNKLVEPITKSPDVSIQCKMDEPSQVASCEVSKTMVHSNRIDITVQCPDDNRSTDTFMTPRRRQSTNSKHSTDRGIESLPSLSHISTKDAIISQFNKSSSNTKASPDLINLPTTEESLSPSEIEAITHKRSSNLKNIEITAQGNTQVVSKYHQDLPLATCNQPSTHIEMPITKKVTELVKKQKIDFVEVVSRTKKNELNNSSSETNDVGKISPKIGKLDFAHKESLIYKNNDKPLLKENVKQSEVTTLLSDQSSCANVDYGEEMRCKSQGFIPPPKEIIPPAHCNTGLDSILAVPLDLSGKSYTKDVTAHCSKQDISYELTLCDPYGTLDLSNKGSSKKIEPVPLSFSEEVVDLRVKNITSTQLADSSIYSEDNCSILTGATDLSLKSKTFNYVPTDLSLKGRGNQINVCESRKKEHSKSEKRETADIIDVQKNICLNLSAKEFPRDLSKKANNQPPTDKQNITQVTPSAEIDISQCFQAADLSCRKPIKQSDAVSTEVKVVENKRQVLKDNLDYNKKINNIHIQIDTTPNSTATFSEEISESKTNEYYNLRKSVYSAPDIVKKHNISEVTISLINSEKSGIKSSSSNIFNNNLDLRTNLSTEKVTCSYDTIMRPFVVNTSNITSTLTKQSENALFAMSDISRSTSKTLNSTTSAYTSCVYTTISRPVINITSNYGHTSESITLEKDKSFDAKTTQSSVSSNPSHQTNIEIKTPDKTGPDPETAKKIAMLPKEIVEILGNMPVDHRNQLLNILPQYVSTSTSPTPKRHDSSTHSTSSNEGIQLNRPVEVLLNEKNSSVPYSLSKSLESKQLPYENYPNFHHPTNNYLTSQTYGGSIFTSSGQFGDNVSINDLELNRQSLEQTGDRIIDLTGDNIDIKPVVLPAEKENNNTSMGLKATTPKPCNEKTASLRAVRIKAPSERQKINVTESHVKITYQENNNVVNKPDDSIGRTSLAVQQFEISTTEEAKVVDSKLNTPVSPDSSFNNASVIKEKFNTEISSVSNETSKEIPTITSSLHDNINVTNNATSIPSNSDGLDTKSESKPIEESKVDADVETVLQKSTEDIDNDSEDDISLAVIVKQKQREQALLNSPTAYQETFQNNRDSESTRQTKLVNDIQEKKSYENRKCSIEQSYLFDSGTDVTHIHKLENNVEVKNSKHSKKSKKAKIISGQKLDEDEIQTNVSQPNDNKVKKSDCIDRENQKVHFYGNSESLQKSENLEVNKSVNNKSEIFEASNKGIEENVKSSNYINNELGKATINDIETVHSDKNSFTNIIPKCHSTTHAIEDKFEVSEGNEKTNSNLNLHAEGTSQMTTNFATEAHMDHTECIETKRNGKPIIESPSTDFVKTDKENTVQPLRRSRRGKSLFISGNELSHDIKNNIETGVEQRAPLTKKQLIFSKLLQDEENTVMCPVKETLIESSDSCKLDLARDNSIMQCNATVAEESMTAFSKKRKQCLKTKKRLKKKKSLDKTSPRSLDFEDVNKDGDDNTSNTNAMNVENVETVTEDSKNTLDDQDVPQGTSYEQGIDERTNAASPNNSKVIGKRKTFTASNKEMFNLKPKKFKSNNGSEINVNVNEVKSNEEISESIPLTLKSTPKIPARRGRSKSVFVKSPTEPYDPYDIDLEDMATETEPIFKREIFNKNSNPKTIHKSNDLPKNIDVHVSTVGEKVIETTNELTNMTEPTESKLASLPCDSDDSSKSDEPLKKYVEEKEKKKLDSQNKDADYQNKTLRKRNKVSLSTNSEKTDPEHCTDENEERIRSEQFMESFGFFSERKPRKSNLLASKKISETFHIIANENDDSFFESKDKSNRKNIHTEVKKSSNDEGNLKDVANSCNKKVSKRGRKKKLSTKIEPSFCAVCRKEFHRPDNFLRHQMTMAHVSRVTEVELKVKNVPKIEDSNYLVIYKHQLDRLRVLQDKITRRKKYCKSLEKITLPTLEEIIADVSRTVSQQQLARRGLSRDEALFLDCCELLNASHNDDGKSLPKDTQGCNINCFSCAQTSAECLNLLEKQINEKLNGKCDDGDVDSITAQDILESEEVRNLENDLISGLKQAACANSFNNSNLNSTFSQEDRIENTEDINSELCSKKSDADNQSSEIKPKKSYEVKDKLYPDVIEDIDMFEDKFDKIKRKCRSQAAKQTQYVETSISPKIRRKSEKKKRKRSPKKSSHNAVPTKGALKGFEGVKVSILTSDINMASILPPSSTPVKKKKRSSSKRKKERKHSNDISYDSDQRIIDSQKKVDVYEFMDNEDAELFEFRPSTLMERFKSISNKDTPSTSKSQPINVQPEVTSESASDGDDFVYMSDDYVCSDEETENSLQSCELGTIKTLPDIKKPVTPPKRRDTTEKSAVMGKIFKHNALRPEKKVIKSKEPIKPKANLDQLFDSLLEEEPSSSMLGKSSISSKNADDDNSEYESSLPDLKDFASSKHSDKCITNYDSQNSDDSDTEMSRKIVKSPSPLPYSSLILQQCKKRKSLTPPEHEDSLPENEFEYRKSPSSKKHEDRYTVERRLEHRKLSNKKKSSAYESFDDTSMSQRRKTLSPNYDDDSLLRVDEPAPIDDHCLSYKRKSKEKEFKSKSLESSEKHLGDNRILDDTGVARQRARRKCTVGKQNVLAETWSSESEPDGVPRRPNSADSVVVGLGRKKKSRKKEGQTLTSRKSNKQMSKRNETEESPRSSRNSCESVSRVVPASRASAVGAGWKARSEYWSDEEPEHVQQHGWIVGDSHKKLVTMLAHAKGKRNNDDKRHLLD